MTDPRITLYRQVAADMLAYRVSIQNQALAEAAERFNNSCTRCGAAMEAFIKAWNAHREPGAT